MTFSIETATIEDAPRLAEVLQKAFANEELFECMNGTADLQAKYQQNVKLIEGFLQRGPPFGYKFLKMVDDNTSCIVGFARWLYPHELSEEQILEKREKEDQRGPFLEGQNVELCKAYYAKLFANRRKCLGEDGTRFFLHILAILPEYQGQGLASMLIRPVLAEADAANAETFLESTAVALPIYKKYGWQPLHELRLDLKPYGGTGDSVFVSMMRPPGLSRNTVT